MKFKKALAVLAAIMMTTFTFSLASCDIKELIDKFNSLEIFESIETSETSEEENSESADSSDPAEDTEVFYYNILSYNLVLEIKNDTFTMSFTGASDYFEETTYGEGTVVKTGDDYALQATSVCNTQSVLGIELFKEIVSNNELIHFTKITDYVYAYGEEMCFIKAGGTGTEIITTPQVYGMEYQLYAYVNQTEDDLKATDFMLINLDNGTQTVLYDYEAFSISLDTTKVGAKEATLTYNGNEYKLSALVLAEDEEIEFPSSDTEDEPESLYISSDVMYITPGTTWAEYCEMSKVNLPEGEELFYYYIETEDSYETCYISEENVTVIDWDATANRTYYEFYFEAVIDGVTYAGYNGVTICAEEDLNKASSFDYYNISIEYFENEEDEKIYNNGLYFVEKGADLGAITAGYSTYGGDYITDQECTISGFDANTLGAQKVAITCPAAEATVYVVIYVYDESNLIPVQFSGMNYEILEDGAIDATNGSIEVITCDGNIRTITGAPAGFTFTVEELMGYQYIMITYNIEINGRTYTFMFSGSDY